MIFLDFSQVLIHTIFNDVRRGVGLPGGRRATAVPPAGSRNGAIPAPVARATLRRAPPAAAWDCAPATS